MTEKVQAMEDFISGLQHMVQEKFKDRFVEMMTNGLKNVYVLKNATVAGREEERRKVTKLVNDVTAELREYVAFVLEEHKVLDTCAAETRAELKRQLSDEIVKRELNALIIKIYEHCASYSEFPNTSKVKGE
jgi:phosphoenolpyruvate carboxylase